MDRWRREGVSALRRSGRRPATSTAAGVATAEALGITVVDMTEPFLESVTEVVEVATPSGGSPERTVVWQVHLAAYRVGSEPPVLCPEQAFLLGSGGVSDAPLQQACALTCDAGAISAFDGWAPCLMAHCPPHEQPPCHANDGATMACAIKMTNASL